MREYVLLQICNNNVKKPTEYNNLINQTFKMNDKLEFNKPIEMHFKNQIVKAKLEAIKNVLSVSFSFLTISSLALIVCLGNIISIGLLNSNLSFILNV